MRLIDADNFNVKRWFALPDNRRTMAEALAAAPTIDAVPVVRCKDCIHWDLSWECSSGGHFCPMIDLSTNPESYCWYGERMDGEENAID